MKSDIRSASNSIGKTAAGITFIILVVSALGFLGRVSWMFELASHFRVQYFVALAGCGAVVFYLGYFRLATAAGVFALVNFAIVFPLYTGLHAEPTRYGGEFKKFRLLLINVNRGNHDYQKVRHYVRSVNPDVVLLLEVSGEWSAELDPLRESYPYEKSLARVEDGIALLSRVPFEDTVVTFIGRAGLPLVSARFAVGQKRLSVIGTHTQSPTSRAKAELRNDQLFALARFVTTRDGPTVLIGDFNVTPWSPFFSDFLRESGLRDSGDGYGVQPTWPAKFPPLWIPIDHCLISPDITVLNRKVGPDMGSDHYPVIVDLAIARR